MNDATIMPNCQLYGKVFHGRGPYCHLKISAKALKRYLRKLTVLILITTTKTTGKSHILLITADPTIQNAINICRVSLLEMSRHSMAQLIRPSSPPQCQKATFLFFCNFENIKYFELTHFRFSN